MSSFLYTMNGIGPTYTKAMLMSIWYSNLESRPPIQ